MDQALLQIEGTLKLSNWAVTFIAFLTFLGIVATALVGMLVVREGRRSDEILREVREDSKRLQFYLFSKLGPADLK